MIAVTNSNGVWRDVRVAWNGDLFVMDGIVEKWIGKQEVYFSEEELQERIEAAVKEHEESKRLISLDKVEIEQHNEYLTDKMKELQKRIAELEAERQPVEVSQELADAIEWLRSRFPDSSTTFLENRVVHDGNIECGQKIVDTLKKTSCFERADIIKRGYIVKPDPLRTLISEVFAEYTENEDMTESQLLDELTTAVKHYVVEGGLK